MEAMSADYWRCTLQSHSSSMVCFPTFLPFFHFDQGYWTSLLNCLSNKIKDTLIGKCTNQFLWLQQRKTFVENYWCVFLKKLICFSDARQSLKARTHLQYVFNILHGKVLKNKHIMSGLPGDIFLFIFLLSYFCIWAFLTRENTAHPSVKTGRHSWKEENCYFDAILVEHWEFNLLFGSHINGRWAAIWMNVNAASVKWRPSVSTQWFPITIHLNIQKDTSVLCSALQLPNQCYFHSFQWEVTASFPTHFWICFNASAHPLSFIPSFSSSVLPWNKGGM